MRWECSFHAAMTIVRLPGFFTATRADLFVLESAIASPELPDRPAFFKQIKHAVKKTISIDAHNVQVAGLSLQAGLCREVYCRAGASSCPKSRHFKGTGPEWENNGISY